MRNKDLEASATHSGTSLLHSMYVCVCGLIDFLFLFFLFFFAVEAFHFNKCLLQKVMMQGLDFTNSVHQDALQRPCVYTLTLIHLSVHACFILYDNKCSRGSWDFPTTTIGNSDFFYFFFFKYGVFSWCPANEAPGKSILDLYWLNSLT